jgi:alpha-beta hydrolase superfamily lysophospholipase
MDRRLSDDLLQALEPILVVQGDRDQSIASARALRDAFKDAGRCNLTYWEFPGLDHHMQDADGKPHIDDVLDRIGAWLRVQVGPGAAELLAFSHLQ